MLPYRSVDSVELNDDDISMDSDDEDSLPPLYLRTPTPSTDSDDEDSPPPLYHRPPPPYPRTPSPSTNSSMSNASDGTSICSMINPNDPFYQNATDFQWHGRRPHVEFRAFGVGSRRGALTPAVTRPDYLPPLLPPPYTPPASFSSSSRTDSTTDLTLTTIEDMAHDLQRMDMEYTGDNTAEDDGSHSSLC